MESTCHVSITEVHFIDIRRPGAKDCDISGDPGVGEVYPKQLGNIQCFQVSRHLAIWQVKGPDPCLGQSRQVSSDKGVSEPEARHLGAVGQNSQVTRDLSVT